MTYYYCPDCTRKGVYFRMLRNGEDNYRCRYCGFYFFTVQPADSDLRNTSCFLEQNNLKELP